MNDTRLDDRFRENSGNRLGEALEAIDDGQQDILRAAVPKLVRKRRRNRALTWRSITFRSSA